MARQKRRRRDPSAQAVAQPPDPHRRSQVVATRVTPLEHQALMTAAVSAQLSLSDYLRRVATAGPVVPKAVQRPPPKAFPPTYIPLARELNAIGVNLNQLARIGNASGYTPAGLEPLLVDVNRILIRLMELERQR